MSCGLSLESMVANWKKVFSLPGNFWSRAVKLSIQ